MSILVEPYTKVGRGIIILDLFILEVYIIFIGVLLHRETTWALSVFGRVRFILHVQYIVSGAWGVHG